MTVVEKSLEIIDKTERIGNSGGVSCLDNVRDLQENDTAHLKLNKYLEPCDIRAGQLKLVEVFLLLPIKAGREFRRLSVGKRM